MRRVTAWIGGIASGVVAYRFWRRHRAPDAVPEPEAPAEPASPEPEAPVEADDRAEELRAKLAETREPEPEPPAEAVAEERPAAEQVEPEAEEPAEPESPDERRSRVHEEGRTALDEMKPD
jgi:hypothetical protein